MRVVAGRLGGRRIASPPSRSRAVRPTSDRARETLFAILGDVSDLLVLDLFCGTGALAIEAISRGADSAIMVDRKTALAQRNVTELGIANRCELVRSDALRYLERTEQRFGLICCDPPYRLADRLEPELAKHLPPRLARYGRLAVECSPRRPLDLDLPLVAERRIGEALITVWSER
ncbi:MAG: methyltransferase [Solirubrobacterales bacterium]|nr:methyltransferase [Solirubrobacterales bacterium]